MLVRIAGIQESLRDSEGIAQVVYFQGCSISCDGCCNPELQDKYGGKEMDSKDIIEYLEERKDFLDSIVFQGGEPTEQTEAVLEIAKWAKNNKLTCWMYTGKNFNNIDKRLLEVLDCIVDGQFVKHLNTMIKKPFRGSSNQTLWRKVEGKWIGDNNDR